MLRRLFGDEAGAFSKYFTKSVPMAVPHVCSTPPKDARKEKRVTSFFATPFRAAIRQELDRVSALQCCRKLQEIAAVSQSTSRSQPNLCASPFPSPALGTSHYLGVVRGSTTTVYSTGYEPARRRCVHFA